MRSTPELPGHTVRRSSTLFKIRTSLNCSLTLWMVEDPGLSLRNLQAGGWVWSRNWLYSALFSFAAQKHHSTINMPGRNMHKDHGKVMLFRESRNRFHKGHVRVCIFHCRRFVFLSTEIKNRVQELNGPQIYIQVTVQKDTRGTTDDSCTF